MALRDKRKTKLFEKLDASSKYFVNSDKETKFSSSYSQAMHLESSDFIEAPENQALIYAIQQIEEDIDELRRYVTASMEIEGDIITKGLISGSQISSSGNISASSINGNTYTIQSQTLAARHGSGHISLGSTNDRLTLNGSTTEIGSSITASSDISASGNFIGNNIGPIYDNLIYLTPADFFPNGNLQSTRNDSGFILADGAYIVDAGRRLSYYAQKVIPQGYEATHVFLKGDTSTDVVKVYSSSFNQNTAGQAGSDGVVNTELNFTSSAIVGGTKGTYCSVEWNAGSGNPQLYGGYIQIRLV